MKIGEQPGDLGRLVDHARALPEVLDLLEGNDVGIPDLAGNAGQIAALVLTFAILIIVADNAHESAFGRMVTVRSS